MDKRVPEIEAMLRECSRLRARARALGAYDKTPDTSPNPLYQPYGPWCPEYGRMRHDPNDAAYRETLAQVGMGIDERGRYWVTRPPPCGHKPGERNTNAWGLSCDGCRSCDG